MSQKLQRVIIFGACSAIAIAVSRKLAADHAELFLVARNAERLHTVAADLRVRGASRVELAVADLADPEIHTDLLARAQGVLGTLDGALLAHGTLPDQAACEQDAHLALQHIHLNFLSHASLLTELAKVMGKQGFGSIAVIGSVAGDRGRQSNYVYGSAKAGLAAFVQGLRHRLWSRGVGVTLIKPGFVKTPMTASMRRKGPLWVSPERVAADILDAMQRRQATRYTPWFWWLIMAIVINLPDFIFRRSRF